MIRLPADLQASAWLHGASAFTTLRTQFGAPLLWQEHLARLAATCAFLGLPDPRRDAEGVLNDIPLLPEGRLRLTVSEGGAWWSFGALPPAPSAPVSVLLGGVQVHPQLAAHKTGNYWPYLLAGQEARAHGVFEALLRDADGHFVDGGRTGFLLQLGGELLVPQGGLPSVTRAALLREWSGPWRETRVTKEQLLRAERLWLTGSGVGVLPVGRVRWQGGEQRFEAPWPEVHHPALKPPKSQSGAGELGSASAPGLL